MAHFHIEGLAPYDGDHEIDVSFFSNRELHTIKRISGVRMGEINEALENEDNDVLLSLVVIALERGGHRVGKQGENRLWDNPPGSLISFRDDEEPEVEEADVGPPAPPKTEPEPRATGDESNVTSLTTSRDDGEDPPATGQSSTGLPHSATGSA